MEAHENLAHIEDEYSRAKLTGIQEGSFAVQEQIASAMVAIHEKNGGYKTLIAAAGRLAVEAVKLSGECQKLMTEGTCDERIKELYKERIKQTETCANIIREAAADCLQDKTKLQGVVIGIEKSNQAIEHKFALEQSKYERHQREAELDAEAEGTSLPNPADDSPADGLVKKLVTEKNAATAAKATTGSNGDDPPQAATQAKDKRNPLAKKAKKQKRKG